MICCKNKGGFNIKKKNNTKFALTRGLRVATLSDECFAFGESISSRFFGTSESSWGVYTSTIAGANNAKTKWKEIQKER